MIARSPIPRRRSDDYGWIKKIRVGDVLRSKSGMLRVVRRVHHWGPTIPQTAVSFTIQRCSWTTRPYTVYNGNDLRCMGYEPTRGRWKLDTPFDRTLARDIDAKNATDCVFHCCDVRGIG